MHGAEQKNTADAISGSLQGQSSGAYNPLGELLMP